MNKDVALKTGGTGFFLISLAQLSRVILRFRVVFGENTQIPVWVNAVAFVVTLGLAVWMFRASR